MFENRREPLLTPQAFRKRVVVYSLCSMGFILFSLGIGIAGYMYYAGLGFTDSLLNASMILTGMGPVDPMPSDGAKIFASLYAIYSGVAFLTSIAVLFAPLLHRLMHRLHFDEDGSE